MSLIKSISPFCLCNKLASVSSLSWTATITSLNSNALSGQFCLSSASTSSSPIFSLRVSKSELISPFMCLSSSFSMLISLSISLMVTSLTCTSSIPGRFSSPPSGWMSSDARALKRSSPTLDFTRAIIPSKRSLCLWEASFRSSCSFINSVSVFSSLVISSKIPSI